MFIWFRYRRRNIKQGYQFALKSMGILNFEVCCVICDLNAYPYVKHILQIYKLNYEKKNKSRF